jgi:hypothetical protein
VIAGLAFMVYPAFHHKTCPDRVAQRVSKGTYPAPTAPCCFPTGNMSYFLLETQ